MLILKSKKKNRQHIFIVDYLKLYIFFDTAIAVTLLGEPETKDLRQ